MKKTYKIAIDGPAGAGKSTIAKILAESLNFLYIDSGAMYRAVTLFLLKNKLLNRSEKEIGNNIKKIKIEFKSKGKKQTVYLNDKNVTKEIRFKEITQNVSKVSAMKCVREEMVKRQQSFGKNSSIVMDGRDIGTAVFKSADLKIYLTASAKTRAERRKKDLDKLHEKSSIGYLIKDINRRDYLDSSREISPLSKANDSIVIDSSKLNIGEVVEKIKVFISD